MRPKRFVCFPFIIVNELLSLGEDEISLVKMFRSTLCTACERVFDTCTISGKFSKGPNVVFGDLG